MAINSTRAVALMIQALSPPEISSCVRTSKGTIVAAARKKLIRENNLSCAAMAPSPL